MNGNSFVDESNESDEYNVAVFTQPSYKASVATAATVTFSVAGKTSTAKPFPLPLPAKPLPSILDFSEFALVAQAEEDELKKDEDALPDELEERVDSPVVGLSAADEIPHNQEAVIDQSTVAPEYEEAKKEIVPLEENKPSEMEDEPDELKEVEHTNGITNDVHHSEEEEAYRQEAREALKEIHAAVPMTEDEAWADDKEEKKQEKEKDNEKEEEPEKEKKKKKKKEKKRIREKGKVTHPNRVSNRLSAPPSVHRKTVPTPRRFREKKSKRKSIGYPSDPISSSSAHEFNLRSGSGKMSHEVTEHAGTVFLGMMHRLLKRSAIAADKKKMIDDIAVNKAIASSLRVPRIYD